MGFDSDQHFTEVVRSITEGQLVPFLGAGVNAFGRGTGEKYQPGKNLPLGDELAELLASAFTYTGFDRKNLLRVSQYADTTKGEGPLYIELHKIFANDYQPNALHRFFATLPTVMREKGYPPYQLIVTTNYDDALERAFIDAKEPFDVVTYIAKGQQRGKFIHFLPNGEGKNVISVPNEYTALPFDNLTPERTVILKIHGAVDREKFQDSNFVITEDHYIDYLTRTDISTFLPTQLAAKLQSTAYLFLGYSLRDWNLRVILHRIWAGQELSYASWAVQLKPDDLDKKFWGFRRVEIVDFQLENYFQELPQRIKSLRNSVSS